MVIEKTETEIRIRMDPPEWKIRQGKAVREFISEIRTWCVKPWDPEKKFWTITREREEDLERLIQRLFRDPNQMTLF